MMIHTKFLQNQPCGSWKEDVCLPYMDMAAILSYDQHYVDLYVQANNLIWLKLAQWLLKKQE